MTARLTAVLLAATMAAACDGSNSNQQGSADARPNAVGAVPAATEWFSERAQELGVDFTHVNGATGKFYYPEILPPGVALFDFDNDGDLDVYLVQGHRLDGPADPSLRGRLYRNDLEIKPFADLRSDIALQLGYFRK